MTDCLSFPLLTKLSGRFSTVIYEFKDKASCQDYARLSRLCQLRERAAGPQNGTISEESSGSLYPLSRPVGHGVLSTRIKCKLNPVVALTLGRDVERVTTVSTDKTTNYNRNDKSKSASADALCPDTQDDMTPAKRQRRYVSVCLFVYGGGGGGGVAEKKNMFRMTD